MKVYIVMGTSGDYSDRREWTICAYRDEAQAKAHVEAAEAREREVANQINANRREWYAARHSGGEIDFNPVVPQNEWCSQERSAHSEQARFWCEEIYVYDSVADAVAAFAADRTAS